MFIKNVLTLLSGTVLAQVLPLLAAPLLSRLYTPVEFGGYGVFIAVVAVFSVTTSLRYDFATAQAENQQDAIALYNLTILISLFLASLFFIFSLLNFKYNLLENYIDPVSLSLAAIGGFLLCNIQVTTYYLNRKSYFKYTAFLKVFQAMFTVSSMVVLAFVDIAANGLIVGHVIGQLVFLISFFYFLAKNGLVNFKDLARASIKYKSYPIHGAPGAIFNTFFLQAPMFFINSVFDAVYAGYYTVINRYLAGPLSLLSVAVSQVLMKELLSDDKVRLKSICKSILMVNFLIVTLFYFTFYVFGEVIIGIALGETWVAMYDYLMILLISVCVRFLVSPMSVILTKEYNIKLALHWQILSLTVLSFFLFYLNFSSFYSFLVYFVLVDTLLYLVYFIQIYRGLGLVINYTKKRT